MNTQPPIRQLRIAAMNMVMAARADRNVSAECYRYADALQTAIDATKEIEQQSDHPTPESASACEHEYIGHNEGVPYCGKCGAVKLQRRESPVAVQQRRGDVSRADVIIQQWLGNKGTLDLARTRKAAEEIVDDLQRRK